MESERPLRDVFADLAGHDAAGPGPAEAQSFLADHGLPNDLLMTAIGSYAGTAPAEVAEHLAPFIAASGAGEGTAQTGVDAAHGLHLLSSVPAGQWHGEVSLTGETGYDLADQGQPGDLGHSGDLSHFSDLGAADSLDQVDHDAGAQPTHVTPTDDGEVHPGDHGGFSEGDTSGGPSHSPAAELDNQHALIEDHDPADQHVPVDGPHLAFDDLPDEQPDHHSPDLTTEHQLDDPAHDDHDAHDLGDLGHFGG